MNFNEATPYRAVKAWAEDALRREREKNDANDLDPIQTAFARGRIALLKELLSLERRSQAIASQDDPD